MKARPLTLVSGEYVECSPDQALFIRLIFPIGFCPLRERTISVQTKGRREGTRNWSWNGNTEAPTLRPSILTRWMGGDSEGNPVPDIVCHSWVTDGMVEFLSDSTHELAGQKVSLIDLDKHELEKTCPETCD